MSREQALGKIHALKRKAGLDDKAYRIALYEATGQTSAADLDEAGLARAIAKLETMTAATRPAGLRQAPAGRVQRKLQALWITAWQLGAVEDRTDKALGAFVKRMLAVDDLRFIPERDANRAIEALRDMCARAGWQPPQGADIEDALRALVPILAEKLIAAGDARDQTAIIKSVLGADPLEQAPRRLLQVAAMDLAKARRRKETAAARKAVAA